MARVTRSKKVDIAEDQTATALGIHTPLPEDGPEDLPLSEIPNEIHTMPSLEQGALAAELKHLKTAYKSAIGAGKNGKKGKNNKKKGRQEVIVQDEAVSDGSSLTTSTPDLTVDYAVQDGGNAIQASSRTVSSEGSLVSRMDNLSLRDLTQPLVDTTNIKEVIPRATRSTRQQLAKEQTGQFDFESVWVGSDRKRQQEDYLSLIAGRSATASRSLGNSLTRRTARKIQATTNEYLLLAEAAAIKATKEMLDLEQATLAQPELVVQKTTTGDNGPRIDHPIQSPAKTPKTLEEVEKAYRESTSATTDATDDSFVEQITCRSPAKPVSRIEDSVEALDQLEEALEAIDQAAMAQRIDSPCKSRHKPTSKNPSRGQSTKEKSKAEVTREQKTGKQQPSKPSYASMRVKSTAPRVSVVKKSTSMIFNPDTTTTSPSSPREQPLVQKKVSSKRPISLLPPKEPVKSTKPATVPVKFELPGEVIARKLKEQREARLAMRESSEESSQTARSLAPKIKSTKPPTRPTFELPGEAVSRRKKEAHEARLKAQEEEERQRREFKAKPLRKSVVPNVAPRETVASRARQSRIGIDSMQGGDPSVAKRAPVVGAHRPSLTQAKLANTSAPRAPGPAGPVERKASIRKASTKFVGPSTSGLAVQRTVSGSDLQAQRQRAKEIYNRDNKLAEDIEREKREREAAAKRSREEAAERGRQASRDWAEKQRARKLAEGDKGMSAGYGPGGQMGLKT